MKNDIDHYVFCLRHFNDIDNIAPVVHFFLESEKNAFVTVLIYSFDYDYRSDKALLFLKNEWSKRIRIKWIGSIFGVPHFFINKSFYRHQYFRLLKIIGLGNPQSFIMNVKKEGRYSKALADYFVEMSIPKTVVFDQNRSSVLKGLISFFRKIGVKRIISLPVSPWCNINVLRQTDFISPFDDNFIKKHEYDGFDEIGQVDSHYSDSLKKFLEAFGKKSPFEGKTSTLGSVRYSTKGIELRKRYVNTMVPRSNNGKIKLLILPSHRKNNSFWDEFIRSLKLISLFDSYEVILKPHTRYGGDYNGLPPSVKVSFEDTSTLIDWADVVVFWSSSVALEGFIKQKTMICLDYINANESIYYKFKLGIIMKSRDELALWLNNDKFNMNYSNYDESEVKLPQDLNRDVSIDYINFILGK